MRTANGKRILCWILMLGLGMLCAAQNLRAEDCRCYRQWVEGETYYAGERVVFENGLYEARITYTAYIGTGWTPQVAALWLDLNIYCEDDGGQPGPAPEPVPEPTPEPTPPPENGAAQTRFIPYFYSWSQDNDSYWVNDVSKMPAGVNHVLVAFALAYGDQIQLQIGDEQKFKSQIAGAQDKGVQVGVSTGGASGSYLTQMGGTPEQVADKFVNFINNFGFQFIGVDFEASYLETPSAVDRMVAIMTAVHKQLPQHHIILTVPSYDGDYGLTDGAVDMARKLYAAGALNAVTAMSFNYYGLNRDVYQAARMSVGLLAKNLTGECTSGSAEQCAQNFDSFPIARGLYGIVSMIGQADDGYVTTTQEQAQQAAFAKQHGFYSIGFWAINRDQGQGCAGGLAICTNTDSATGAFTQAVLSALGSTPAPNPDPTPQPTPNPEPEPTSKPVTMFQHCDFGGYSVGLDVGSYDLNQLMALGVFNDDISSIKIADGYQVTLYQHWDFTGNSLLRTSNDNCLVNDGFNDEISSIIVTATAGQGCDGIAPWVATSVYWNGDQVAYNNSIYEAQWWTQGETPGTANVWLLIDDCSNSSMPSPNPNPDDNSGGGDTYTGYACYHNYDGVPATSTYCVLDPAAYGMMVTALRTDLDQAYKSAHGVSACGKKVVVTNTATGASVTVTIIDHSNDYGNNGGTRYLDLSQQAFSAIGNIYDGVIPVTFTIKN